MLRQGIASLSRRPRLSCARPPSHATSRPVASPGLIRCAARPPRPLSTSSHLVPHSRSLQTSAPFQPLQGPPAPASLGAPRAARSFTRSRRWLRRLLILAAAGGAVYVVDSQVYASGLGRSLRTFATGVLVALDYKINFRQSTSSPGTPPRSLTRSRRQAAAADRERRRHPRASPALRRAHVRPAAP